MYVRCASIQKPIKGNASKHPRPHRAAAPKRSILHGSPHLGTKAVESAPTITPQDKPSTASNTRPRSISQALEYRQEVITPTSTDTAIQAAKYPSVSSGAACSKFSPHANRPRRKHAVVMTNPTTKNAAPLMYFISRQGRSECVLICRLIHAVSPSRCQRCPLLHTTQAKA